MPKIIVMDEIHLTVSAPAGLPKHEYGAIRRALIGSRFQSHLLKAMQHLLENFPVLRKARFTVTR